jgi:hypothetical protein
VAKPEEKELEGKKSTLAELEEVLASSELKRATLETQLLGFQRVYLEAVGELIAELDELEARIAEAIAGKQPLDETSTADAARARNRAKESARAYREESRASFPKSELAPTEELKKLFRSVARRIHPDLASNDEDRAIREELMKRANEAYHMGNAGELRSILNEYEARPESVEGEDVGAQLVRVIRKIDLVQQRLVQIKQEIGQLMKSELFILRQKAETAKLENRDFLAEMAAYLRQKIVQARKELQKKESGVLK